MTLSSPSANRSAFRREINSPTFRPYLLDRTLSCEDKFLFFFGLALPALIDLPSEVRFFPRKRALF